MTTSSRSGAKAAARIGYGVAFVIVAACSDGGGLAFEGQGEILGVWRARAANAAAGETSEDTRVAARNDEPAEDEARDERDADEPVEYAPAEAASTSMEAPRDAPGRSDDDVGARDGGDAAALQDDPATVNEEEAARADAGSGDEQAGEAEDAGLLLIDTQIAAVTTAANLSGVARADVALSKVTDEALAAFAREARAEHERAQTRQAALFAQKRFVPKENVVSRSLAADADATLAELTAARGADAQARYLDAQIRLQEELLSLLDQVLLPSVCDGDFKTELRLVREEVGAQRARARVLESALGR